MWNRAYVLFMEAVNGKLYGTPALDDEVTICLYRLYDYTKKKDINVDHFILNIGGPQLTQMGIPWVYRAPLTKLDTPIILVNLNDRSPIAHYFQPVPLVFFLWKSFLNLLLLVPRLVQRVPPLEN